MEEEKKLVKHPAGVKEILEESSSVLPENLSEGDYRP